MPVNLISEDELRAALRPFRIERDKFEAAVRERLKAAETQPTDEPLMRLSPLLRSAAAFLPLEVLAGCKGTAAAAKLAPTGGAYKLLSYLAFPAISLFVLLGATIFSISKIRTIQDRKGSALSDQEAIQAAVREWWRRHRWGGWAVFAATMALMMVGVTWILFLFYLLSFGLLLFVLTSYAKLGLGNRVVIGRSCGMGLMFLGQGAAMVGIGNREIHFLDQKLVSAVFYGGCLILLPFTLGGLYLPYTYTSKVARRNAAFSRRLAFGFMVVLLVPLMAWMMNPILWPVTPARIKHYVESFAEARYGSVTWRTWEIAARWAIDSKLNPDLSRPRRLLAEGLTGEQDRYILSSALRVGLLPADEVGLLKEYESLRRSLLAAPPGSKPQVIAPLEQYDWVIRAALLRNDLSPQERDLLEQRLHATLENMSSDRYVVLETALHVTQLLDAIERPLDRDQYRAQMHDLLQKFAVKSAGWAFIAGGFKKYSNWPTKSWISQPGDLETTAQAVELMEIYGIPDDLDLNWVRSFLRPTVNDFIGNRGIVAAAAIDRLNHIPGATRPTWWEVLYYERTLLAATVLVGLCLYATFSSPKPKTIASADRSSAADRQKIADGHING